MDQLALSAHMRSLANPVGGPIAAPERLVVGADGRDEVPAFADLLQEQIAEVNSMQVEAQSSIESLVSGQSDDIHSTMIAVQKADVSFKLLMAVRNKLLDAYDEVMRMQI